ncbi:hypothetical protein F5Y01DRAFT_316483 [Xylaria sp. FL0043]|nr:hypothetical protein F5Y01DRAFT_316483 [Xylaria sp. FL0043]
MRGRVVKSRQACRPRVKPLLKPSQSRLLDAVVAGEDIGEDPPPNHGKQSSVGKDLTQGTTAHTRRPGVVSDIPSSPAQRRQSTRTDPQRSRVKDGKADQRAQPTRQTSRPKPPKGRDTSLPESKVEAQGQVPPATRSRKRQIVNDDDKNDNKEPKLKRARLTRKNLGLFDKMARKKGSNRTSASASESTVGSSTTQTTSTTMSGFRLKTYKNNLLPPRLSKPPSNLENIHERHTRSRASPPPTESEHKCFMKRVAGAPNESTVLVETSSKLLKEYNDEGYKRVFNKKFTGFSEYVGFNEGLSAPQPDFVEGLEMTEYRPFYIDDHIKGAVIYKDDPFSLTLPHLAGEWKARGKNMEQAMLQSAYDGAVFVFARNEALSYLGKPDPPGHAEIITFATDGTTINFFAHYAAPSADGTLEYHQYPYASADLKRFNEFVDGRRAIRNRQDHAREQSYALRDQLKEHSKQQRDGLQPIAEEAPLLGSNIVPEAPLLTQESNTCVDSDGEVEQPPTPPTPPPAKSLASKRKCRKAPLARTDKARNKTVAPPLPPSSNGCRRSARLLKAFQLSSEISQM